MQDISLADLRIKLLANQIVLEKFNSELRATNHPSEQIKIMKARLPFCAERLRLLGHALQLSR